MFIWILQTGDVSYTLSLCSVVNPCDLHHERRCFCLCAPLLRKIYESLHAGTKAVVHQHPHTCLFYLCQVFIVISALTFYKCIYLQGSVSLPLFVANTIIVRVSTFCAFPSVSDYWFHSSVLLVMSLVLLIIQTLCLCSPSFSVHHVNAVSPE